MKEVRHSLLIPCYNAAGFLPQLAEQIAAITPPFDEVLLVDDGSSDDTVAVASALGLPMTRLEKNAGPGAARNRLAEIARGEWIHFLDVDDLIHPAFLNRTSGSLSPETDVLLCAGEFVDANGKREQLWEFDESAFATDPVEAAFVTPVPTFCSMIRRSVFLETGGFDEIKRCWEDGDLHLRLAASGARFRVIGDVLSTSPRHDTGASSSHLYCHRCRLEFAEHYFESGLPIPTEAFANEFRHLGERLLEARQYRLAGKSFALAEQCGLNRSRSRNQLFDWILSRCRPRTSQFLSASARSVARSLTPTRS